jgi:ligand-binding sensor domain-containing protein
MRLLPVTLLLFFSSCIYGQFPYMKKMNFPEQLPTQVVYDMLTDSKGYIWLGTDKGLFRFNGRTFVTVPFDNTSSRAVSYLQEDEQGTIWCMNFYNQLFSFQKDTLRKFEIDYTKLVASGTFNNVTIDSKSVWFHSFYMIYEFDKTSRKLVNMVASPVAHEQIISAVANGNDYYAFTHDGFLFSNKKNKWKNIEQKYYDFKFIQRKGNVVGISAGYERNNAFEISGDNCISLDLIDLPADVYIFQGVCIENNEYWLCTQNGAYRWNKSTGETKCFFPNERVSDVVKDYQGNYWFSTLDNGVFICTSLYNSVLKIYNDPLLDNFTRLQALPNGEILAGSSQGTMAKINLENRQTFAYNMGKMRETEFISYDTLAKIVISNRGIFQPDQKEPVELLDYSKGVQRDKFGNLLVAAFNGAFILNDKFRSLDRYPLINCPLYADRKFDSVMYDGKYSAKMIRQRRSLSVLSSMSKDCFWVGYEDGLYEYHYDGAIIILKDKDGLPVIAKSLQQQFDGSLVVGTSTRGVMIFREGKNTQTYHEKNGLSSVFVRKVLKQDTYIWVLTDAGLDRIDGTNGAITNYLEEYGLTNTIINDFIIDNGKILFATPGGILLRYNLPKYFNFEIKFPLLKASSNGLEISNNAMLPDNSRDILFYFEALHYLSTTALTYRYRLIGIDTIWRSVGNFNNQLAFNRLSPGKYMFEIKAVAGPNYKSVVRSFSFIVPRPFWQKIDFVIAVALILFLLLWLFLRHWKQNLLDRQLIKERVLKSQLVALRAQMNPHFLYNVLNTVQGLVYGNRKTEAGELLGNFSDLMRKTLQASDKQLLPLKDEIENLRLYLELEKARFDEGFTYQIDVIDIDDLSSIYVPSLMLQPFAENSVKHGLMHKQGIKKVEIRFEKEGDGLHVVIDDNGIGRMQSMEINKRSKSKPYSFATVALNERMDLFNRLYKQKITCRIIDKIDERQQSQGTRVELYIPDYSNDPHAL